MDSIFKLFLEPQKWIDWFFPVIMILIAKPLLIKSLVITKSIIKYYKLVELKKIRKLRHSEYQVHFQINKNSSYFTVFLCSCLLFYVAALTTPIIKASIQNGVVFFIVMAPVFMCELAWLNQDAFTKQLIKRADRIKGL